VVLVTGPPGAGKSTVAGAIASRSARSAVHLHSDDFYGYIRSGFVEPWQPASDPQNRVVTGAIAAAAVTFGQGGYLVLVDGILGPWFLPAFRDAAARAGVPLHYLVLRPSLAENLSRARGRAAGQFRASGPVSDLHRQFSDLGDLERHVLDSTGESAEETTGRVLAALRSGQGRLAGWPDDGVTG
jgi:AAA domain